MYVLSGLSFSQTEAVVDSQPNLAAAEFQHPTQGLSSASLGWRRSNLYPLPHNCVHRCRILSPPLSWSLNPLTMGHSQLVGRADHSSPRPVSSLPLLLPPQSPLTLRAANMTLTKARRTRATVGSVWTRETLRTSSIRASAGYIDSVSKRGSLL